jgi:hypothetical protein
MDDYVDRLVAGRRQDELGALLASTDGELDVVELVRN